jgi:hypothetical protein
MSLARSAAGATAARDESQALRDEAEGFRDEAQAASALTTPVDTPLYSHAFDGEDGSIAGGFVKGSGLWSVGATSTEVLNAFPTKGYFTRREYDPVSYESAIHLTIWNGQSLQERHRNGANHTTEQEYGVFAFEAQAAAPTAYYPAIATSIGVTGTSEYGAPYAKGESPMFGMSYQGELAEKLDGIRIDQIGLKHIIVNNGVGSTSLAAHAQGGASGTYALMQGQVAGAKTIAANEGWPLVARAVMWNQGESGSGTDYTYAGYKAALQNLAVSYDSAIRAITGGADPVYLITGQTNSAGPHSTSDRFGVARAQLHAAIDHANVLFSTPQYFFEYGPGDELGLHLTAHGAKWRGAYDALVYQRVIIEGGTWEPLRFVFDSRVGNFVYLRAVGAEGPLAIDTNTLPPQANHGFTATTAALAAVNVVGVTLAGTDLIRVQLANYAAGHRIQYAMNVATGMGYYTGGAGNIRDSLGDRLPMFEGNGIDRKMHKWAAAHEIIV